MLELLSRPQRENISSNHYGFIHFIKLIQEEYSKDKALRSYDVIRVAWRRATYFGKNLKIFDFYMGDATLRKRLVEFLNGKPEGKILKRMPVPIN